MEVDRDKPSPPRPENDVDWPDQSATATPAAAEVLGTADLLRHVLRAVDDPNPDVVARAKAYWCATSRAARAACEAEDAAWDALLRRAFAELLEVSCYPVIACWNNAGGEAMLATSLARGGECPRTYVKMICKATREDREFPLRSNTFPCARFFATLIPETVPEGEAVVGCADAPWRTVP